MTNSYIIIQSSARENARSNIVYCDYNGISMIYVNSNTAQGKKQLNDNLQ